MEEKKCCSVCDTKKLCYVCGTATLFACSDCRIEFKVSVYVCGKSECRSRHESKCHGNFAAQIEEAEREAFKSGCRTHLATCADEFKTGFAAAREKARGIVMNEAFTHGLCEKHGWGACECLLADRISKMEP